MAAPVEESSRNNWFYARWTAVAATYVVADQSRQFSNSMNNLKIHSIGGDVIFSLVGPDGSRTEGRVLAGEEKDFRGCSVHRIAVRQASATITDLRVWAYS